MLSMLLFCHALAGAFLPLLILSGVRVSAENINFHDVRPPLDPTPFPNSFKCFTCESAVDNYNCNRWAEDRWCPESKCNPPEKVLCDSPNCFSLTRASCRRWSHWPGLTCRPSGALSYGVGHTGPHRFCRGTQYCLTVHLFTDHGKSTSVTKKCATGEECHFVGCHHHEESGHTECISCCEGMICNVDIPTNHTNAVFAVLHTRRTSDGSRRTVNMAVLVSVVMIALS